jgi:hypothetical protein
MRNALNFIKKIFAIENTINLHFFTRFSCPVPDIPELPSDLEIPQISESDNTFADACALLPTILVCKQLRKLNTYAPNSRKFCHVVRTPATTGTPEKSKSWKPRTQEPKRRQQRTDASNSKYTTKKKSHEKFV